MGTVIDKENAKANLAEAEKQLKRAKKTQNSRQISHWAQSVAFWKRAIE